MLSDGYHALPVLSVLSVCLTCLSVTLVYCGQTVRRIKMQLGMRRGVTTAGDTGDASPVRPTMSPLHQNDNRQFIFGTDF